MKFKPLILFVVATSVHCQNAPASQSAQTLQSALKEAIYPVTVTAAGALEGVGGKVITEAINQTQFVLIGETHFTRETPRFAAAVCRIMRPDRYAVETGPYAAAYVDGLLNDPQREARMTEREREFPDNMAMLNIEQENDLAATCAASSQKKGDFLWGLDQEFEAAAPVLLQQMNAQPNGQVSAAEILSAIATERQVEARVRPTGDLSRLFLNTASDREVAELQAAIKKDGTPATQSLMHEFAESRRIYQLYLNGSWSSNNSERASLLKQHFLERFRALQREKPAPRILLKFGDNHMWKGFNDTHQLDLGNSWLSWHPSNTRSRSTSRCLPSEGK